MLRAGWSMFFLHATCVFYLLRTHLRTKITFSELGIKSIRPFGFGERSRRCAKRAFSEVSDSQMKG
jgi:hypothetical protein